MNVKRFHQMTALGDYISRLRSEKGWSYRDLADRTPAEYKVSFATIQDIENGKTENPGVKALVGLSKALNISVMKLILAYQGQDPDQATDKELDEDLREALAIKKALDEVRKRKE